MGRKCSKTQKCIADRALGFPKKKCRDNGSSEIAGWLKFLFLLFQKMRLVEGSDYFNTYL